jgi:hypothetical protein
MAASTVRTRRARRALDRCGSAEAPCCIAFLTDYLYLQKISFMRQVSVFRQP